MLGVKALWQVDSKLLEGIRNDFFEVEEREDSRNDAEADSTDKPQTDAQDLFVSDNGVAFVPPSMRQGILPLMLRELLEMRIKIKVMTL